MAYTGLADEADTADDEFESVAPYRPSLSSLAQLPAAGQPEFEFGGLRQRSADYAVNTIYIRDLGPVHIDANLNALGLSVVDAGSSRTQSAPRHRPRPHSRRTQTSPASCRAPGVRAPNTAAKCWPRSAKARANC